MPATLDSGSMEKAARFIACMRLRRDGFRPPQVSLPSGCVPESLEDGYAIQERARRLIAEGGLGEPVGWKVGATAAVMQERLGIPFPCAGTLYRGAVHRLHARVDRRTYASVMLECEIGVRLAAGLPARPGGHTRDSVAAAVAGVMCSIEIVDRRWTDPAAVGAATHIADDFFSCGAIFGEEHPVGRIADAGAIAGEIRIGGEVAFAGRASDILGHPLNSLAWLADHCAGRGTPLEAGDLITLGSISPGIPVPEPGRAEVRFDGLGSVTAVIV